MFDPAKFIEAAKAIAQAKPKPITIPGIGKAFHRHITVADVEAAGDVRERLEKAGAMSTKMSMAIDLALKICDQDGAAVFDMNNDEHLKLLASLPWDSVRGLSVGEGNG